MKYNVDVGLNHVTAGERVGTSATCTVLALDVFGYMALTVMAQNQTLALADTKAGEFTHATAIVILSHCRAFPRCQVSSSI